MIAVSMVQIPQIATSQYLVQEKTQKSGKEEMPKPSKTRRYEKMKEAELAKCKHKIIQFENDFISGFWLVRCQKCRLCTTWQITKEAARREWQALKDKV